MIPYPYAAHDHQTYNARSIAEKGGGIVISDEDCGSGKIIPVLSGLLENEEKRNEIRKCAAALATPDTDDRIFNAISDALSKQD